MAFHVLTMLTACCQGSRQQPEYQNLTLPCFNNVSCPDGTTVGAPFHWTAAVPAMDMCTNVLPQCAAYTELLQPMFEKQRRWRRAGGVQAEMLRKTWDRCVLEESFCTRIRIHDGQIFVWDSSRGFDSTRSYASVLMFMRMAYRFGAHSLPNTEIIFTVGDYPYDLVAWAFCERVDADPGSWLFPSFNTFASPELVISTTFNVALDKLKAVSDSKPFAEKIPKLFYRCEGLAIFPDCGVTGGGPNP
jgi:hypothetical protein